ncbi:MAG: hypothetical protein ACP5GU_05145 [Thermoprotei archaeon]
MITKLRVVTKQVTVIKLGGSILKAPQDFDEILKKLLEQFEGHRLILVVSAIKGITDLIISACENPSKDILEKILMPYYNALEELELDNDAYEGLRKLSEEFVHVIQNCINSQSYKDKALSFGERASALIVNGWLRSKGYNSRVFGPSDIGLITTSEYSNASPLMPYVLFNIKGSLEKVIINGVIPVIPGFIGVNAEGNITTMGRGASDLSAVLVAQSLEANNLYLITETPGIMSADPKIVPDARVVPLIDLDEARVAAEYKVKNLHKKTFDYISGFSGVIKIVNKNFIGTTITGSYSPDYIKIVTNHNDLLIIIGRGVNKDIKYLLNAINLNKWNVLNLNEVHAVLKTPSNVYDVMCKVHKVILGMWGDE